MPANSHAQRLGLRRPIQATKVTEDASRPQDRDDPNRIEQAQARTDARDAAYGWGAARRRLDARTRAWIAALERARELGALPGVLGDYIREGAERAGIDPSEVPVEVWRAAGLDHP